MSDSAAAGGDSSREPSEIANAARLNALEELDQAAEHDSVVDRAKAEQEAAVEFAEGMAQAVETGLSAPHLNSACSQFADAAEYYTKTDLTDLVEEKQEELEYESDSRRPFDEILESDLNEVVIVRTTDARQATHYRWQFTGGSLETTANADARTHFHWSNFRDEYYDAVGEDPAKPRKEVRGGEEWREFVVSLVENRGREVETRGPRSAAVDALRNFVGRSRAYADIEEMVERDGLYLDDDPEAASELWVQNTDIKRICDNAELESVRELQVELDARGYTVDRINGVSESTTVNGSKITYWVLDAAFAEPYEYIEDPDDPAEQLRAEEDDDTDDDSDEDGFGAIGAVGGNPDE